MNSVGTATIRLHVESAEHTISRHIYGHFAEHLGHGIYGGFYVGDASPIPNINGVRRDVIDALRKIKIPNLRWPGGCFADTYHWRDGIGSRDLRPSIHNTWWGEVTEDNSFGTHDFLNLCEVLGAEPFISANVGSGTVRELSEWVQYVNSETTEPMSILRKSNGRETPWRVRYWGIGNEPWGCGGNMRAEFYADTFRQFATFMTGWSNSTGLFRIAAGAQSDDYHWTEVLMKGIPRSLMEGLGLHHYTVIDWNNKGPATGFSREQYMLSMKKAWLMDELIRNHGEIMDRYDPEKKIALVVDEWGGWYDPEPGTNPGFLFQQNTMRDAMIAAVTLNIFNTHCSRLRMANLAQAVNVLQCLIFTNDTSIVLTPTYHVFDMYSSHQDGRLIPLEISIPHVREKDGGAPMLSASASVSRNGDSLMITICNIDPDHACDIEIHPGMMIRDLSARILSSKEVDDCNTFQQPYAIHPVEFQSFHTNGDSVSMIIPPTAIISLQVSI